MSETKVYQACVECSGRGDFPSVLDGDKVVEVSTCLLCKGTGRGKISEIRDTESFELELLVQNVDTMIQCFRRIERLLEPPVAIVKGPDAPAPPWISYAWAIMRAEDGCVFGGEDRSGRVWTRSLGEAICWNDVASAAAMVAALGNPGEYTLVRVPMLAVEHSLLT